MSSTDLPVMGPTDTVLALHCVSDAQFAAWRDAQPAAIRQWLAAAGFQPERGRWLLLPGPDGAMQGAVVGTGKAPPDTLAWFWLGAALGDKLPAARFAAQGVPADAALVFTLGWNQGGYRFLPYRARAEQGRRARLEPLATVDLRYVAAATAASALARDLINTPANDLGPAELARHAEDLARRCGGVLSVVSGEALQQGMPLIAAVGQGSPRAPRLLDLRFARPGAPRVTLVGKGVCFDTGGLDLKPAAGMALMKKDMGGAAMALGAAQLLRDLDVPVDLRVLVPAVENGVDGAAQRPGDVWRSRKGLTVEITNTDAEGRLVLADALALAGEEPTDLLVDFATLTGAARVALGPELPPVYGADRALVTLLAEQGDGLADPLWPMPLWDPYEDELGSRIADLNNCPSGGMAGSLTAALFLRRFVADPARWLHLDVYGWNAKERAGRPAGAEAQGIRAVVSLLQQRYG